MVSQIIGNFSRQALLEHPELYLDEKGNPCTKETILDAAYLSEYRIDGKQTLFERYYELLRRYRF